MARGKVYDITDFPPVGLYYKHFPGFTATQFAELSHPPSKPKVILVGDPSVGKTTLVNTMKVGVFKANYNPTVGVAFISITCTINGCETKLAFYDTTGNEKPNALTRQFYRGADIALICFDLSSKMSFDHVSEWYEAIQAHCADSIRLFLVGCKADCSSTVEPNDIQRRCESCKMEYWSTSAKTATHVTELLMRVCLLGVVSELEQEPTPDDTRIVKLTDSPGDHSGRVKKPCC
jgi:Ras-related protein Rab-6A